MDEFEMVNEIIDSIIKNVCRLADENGYDRDDLLETVSIILSDLSDYATIEHFKED